MGREGFVGFMCLSLVTVLVLFSNVASSKHVVTHLPGFDGELPFYLGTGSVNFRLFS